MLFHKSTVSAESGWNEWKLMSYVNEVNEKLSGPCHRCTLDSVAFIHFPLLAGFMFACNGQVNEWTGTSFSFSGFPSTRNLTLYFPFISLKSRKNVSICADRHGNSPIHCDSFPLALLYFDGDSSWFCRYVIRPTLCAVNVTWSGDRVTSLKFKKANHFLKKFSSVEHIPVVK